MTKDSTAKISSISEATEKHDEFNQEFISVAMVLKIIMAGKWIILAFVFIASAGSVYFALSIPNQFQSYALLAPVELEGGGGGLGNSGLRGLAGLAGVSLGSSNTRQKMALETLSSRWFILKFIEKHDLAVPLMAGVIWDAASNKSQINPERYSVEKQQWLSDGKVVAYEPTATELYETFMDHLLVDVENKKSQYVSISIDFYSPVIAKEWVTLLVNDINAYMKDKTVKGAEKNIEYLEAQVKETRVVEMQKLYYGLIEEQIKSSMLANGVDEYVFEYVDPPFIPDRKIKPKRTFIVMKGAMGGLIIGVFIVFCLALRKSNKSV